MAEISELCSHVSALPHTLYKSLNMSFLGCRGDTHMNNVTDRPEVKNCQWEWQQSLDTHTQFYGKWPSPLHCSVVHNAVSFCTCACAFANVDGIHWQYAFHFILVPLLVHRSHTLQMQWPLVISLLLLYSFKNTPACMIVQPTLQCVHVLLDVTSCRDHSPHWFCCAASP